MNNSAPPALVLCTHPAIGRQAKHKKRTAGKDGENGSTSTNTLYRGGIGSLPPAPVLRADELERDPGDAINDRRL
jgi:hypothetical protein